MQDFSNPEPFCPVHEVVYELKFIPAGPPDAVFGLIYSRIQDLFTNFIPLPVLQAPEKSRNSDPSLMFQPHYALTSKAYPAISLRIGPRVIAFNNIAPYYGWDTFFEFIKIVFNALPHLHDICTPERFGLRYINFFPYPMLNKTTLSVNMNGTEFDTQNITIRTEIQDGEFIKLLQIVNNADIRISNGQRRGSLLDIDCLYVIPEPKPEFFKDYEILLHKARGIQKNTFSGMLTPDFLPSVIFN